MDTLYAVVRVVARFWIWFFFERVEVRHAERVPRTGPVLLCINHPNNLIDSLLVASVLPRQVHYLATGTLFRNRLLARLLVGLGVIAVYRKTDHPESHERTVEMFAACEDAFERGQVIAIYPEGATRAEASLPRIKTGAARIALGYEMRAPGRLTVVPVGLSFAAHRRFRGRVLVSFGEPVGVSSHRVGGGEERAKGLHALTAAIQAAMQRELVRVEHIDTAGFAHAVEALYRGDLERELWEKRSVSGRPVVPVPSPGSIATALEHVRARDPESLERLWQRILGYRVGLEDYRRRDATVRARLEGTAAHQPVARSWQTIAGLPLFAYGAVVNFLPYYLPGWLAGRMSRQPTDYATIRLLSSIVAFPLFWAIETALVSWTVGLRWALPFFVSLPLGGLLAYRYLAGTGRLRHELMFGALLLTRAQEARRLLAERRQILAELERARLPSWSSGRFGPRSSGAPSRLP